MSAPSRAKAMATARPMPLSPPVITAFLPASRPLPLYEVSPWSGTGFMASVVPGIGCCCFGNGGLG